MRKRKRKRSLRSLALYRVIARMQFRGWTMAKIGRKLGRTQRAITYLTGTPEYDAIYSTYEAAQLAHFDRAMPTLLLSALDALAKLVKHADPRIRQAAVALIVERTQILEKLAARALERQPGARAGTGSPGTPAFVVPPEGLSDQQREAARAEMARMKAQMLGVPSKLTERVRALNGPSQN